MFRGSSSDYARNLAYAAKMRVYSGTGAQPDYSAPVCQFKMAEMHRKFAIASSEMASITDSVTGLLGVNGISVVQAGSYHAFSMSLYKLQRVMVGEALAVEAAVVIALWVARGLSQSVLEAIRSQVFSIAAPVGE